MLMILISHTIQKMIQALGKWNNLQWFCSLFLLLMLVYNLYLKFMQRLLKHLKLTPGMIDIIIEVVWSLTYSIIVLPFMLNYTNSSLMNAMLVTSDWSKTLVENMIICKQQTEDTEVGVQAMFVVYSSFSLWETLITWKSKGFKNAEFLQKQSVFAAYVVTYYSRCSLLGVTLVLLANRVTLMILIAKFLNILGFLANSRLLRKISTLFCIYHVVLWAQTFFFSLPNCFNTNKNINSHMTSAELNILIVIDFLGWFIICTSIVNSVVCRYILNLMTRTGSQPVSLEYCLFGVEFMHLKPQRSLAVNNPEDAHIKTDYLKVFAQTVRCSIILKRKLRRIRERKANKDQKMD